MLRRLAAPRSNVALAVCALHGLFFHGGQYERFAAFAAAGGLELAPGVERQERDDAAARERSRQRDAKIRDRRDNVNQIGLDPYWPYL